MDVQAEVYLGNALLNKKKFLILQEYSRVYSPQILRKIVLENPFFLNNEPINEPALYRCDYTQQTIAQEIDKILRRNVHIYARANFSVFPLDTATWSLRNQQMYDAVKLLITCGAEVNITDKWNKTPIHVLCSKIEENMAMKTLRFMLKRGKNAISAVRHENKFSILEIAISSTKCFFIKVKIAKLLLEFGAKPSKNILCQILNIRMLRKEKCDVLSLIKLLMQYLLFHYFKNNKNLKVNKLVSAEEYNEIMDLSSISFSVYYDRIIEYRNNLIKELSEMVHNKLDEYTTLFTYVSDRCSRGVTQSIKEEPLMYKVLSIQHSKRYMCCEDLIRASIKRTAILPIFCDLTIFVRKSSNEKVILNLYTVSHLASYLSRTSMINLVHVFWTEPVKKENIPMRRSLRKRTRESLDSQIHEDDPRLNDSSIAMQLKYRKLSKNTFRLV